MGDTRVKDGRIQFKSSKGHWWSPPVGYADAWGPQKAKQKAAK